MKQIYFLVIAFSFFTTVKSQIVNIPDAKFKAKLLAASTGNTTAKNISGNYFKIDANANGEIETSEALQVSYLDINYSAINDLTGILNFNNLNYLSCEGNYLTVLDVNSLPNLNKLFCGSNRTLALLNVSNLNNLEVLYCNNNNISSLDVNALSKLSSLNCSFNKLTTLNVSSLSNLVDLYCYSNQISMINLGTSTKLKNLDCNTNLLSSINIDGLINLEIVNCSRNKIATLNISTLINLVTLNCSENQILSLDLSNLINLQSLDCGRNQLSVLDLNGLVKLIVLNCNNNVLLSLNVSNLTTLKLLNCGANKISSLDVNSLKTLTSLDCYENQISTINISDLTGLTRFNCRDNQISSLNVNNLVKLEDLVFSKNKISSIEINNLTNLVFLYCSENLITTLDVSKLIKLTDLNVSSNPLNTLDVINLINLRYLTCSYNNLSNLLLPKLLNLNLDCSNNLLQSLDLSMVSKMNSFICSNNNLSYLCVKNGGKDNTLHFENNPSGLYICADESEIDSILNYSNIWPNYNSYIVNSYCSFVPGGTNYTIKGNQKWDSNANGCDVLDSVVSNLKFNIAKGATLGSFICDFTGNYSIPVQAGTHIITPIIENPTYFNVSPTNATITFPTQASPFSQNFCVTSNGVHPDLEISLLPLLPARPGFDAKYKIIYKNKGTTTQSGSVNLAFDDAVLDLVVSNPLATTQSTNKLSWDFIDLLPFETREITFTLNVNSPMETPAVNSGFVLAYTATITSVTTDETPIDNTFDINQIVVNSFDPNDKTCLEGTVISPSLIGQYVHYMIRFENNGTANAQNIVVKDMIDLSKFDISTLIPTSSSHSFVTNVSAGNKVEFIFENINLPFDDANNDGYIAFKIKTLPTLQVNDTFSNEASIFFDYNFPIVTKLASSTFKTLSIQDFEFATYFTLYPNPAKGVLNIIAKETIEVQSISVYNTLGQLVLIIPNADKMSKIDVSSLTSGNYFIKINSDKGTSNSKFIKE